jgi:exopolysaccharide biosynthesis predicted pyruvyltransferase EpsI
VHSIDEKCHLPKLTLEEIDHLNRPKYISKIEPTIKTLSRQEVQGTDRFYGQLFQTFKEEFRIVLYNIFQKIETGVTYSLSITSVTLTPKLHKYITRKEQKPHLL